MLLSFLISCLCYNYRPINYQSIKMIKSYYYHNLLTYDIYENEIITNNKLLTAEHIFPQSFTKRYLEAKRDMHNIFLTNAENNIYRSNYPFADSKIDMNQIEKREKNVYKFFVPPDFAKGQIARTIAYMKYIYPKLEINNVINNNLLLEWNDKFCPSFLENKRNELIYDIQGNYNIFILQPELINQIFN